MSIILNKKNQDRNNNHKFDPFSIERTCSQSIKIFPEYKPN